MGSACTYPLVYFEICGVCNGRCRWCQTARRKPPGRFIDPAAFGAALDRLLLLKLVDPRTVINLYDWGEPFLHPDLNGVLRELAKRGLTFGLSTNASRYVALDPAVLGNLCQITFSMPGFSQASYDRIHGFRFDAVLENIDRMLRHLKACRFGGTVLAHFHLYQFNLGEIGPAASHFAGRNVCFKPSAAFIADLDLMMAYLTGSMDGELLRAVGRDFLLYHVEPYLATRPASYRCPQFDILTVDEDCQALTCCAVSKHHEDYAIGPLADLSAEELRTRKTSRAICGPCIASGAAFLANASYLPDFVRELTLREYGPRFRLGRYVPRRLKAALKRLRPRRGTVYLGDDATFYVEKHRVDP